MIPFKFRSIKVNIQKNLFSFLEMHWELHIKKIKKIPHQFHFAALSTITCNVTLIYNCL